MFIINVSDPLTLVLLLTATVLLIFLGKEIKKPGVPAVALTVFLILILVHSVQYGLVDGEEIETLKPILLRCLSIDAIMIFISFFGYLWIDDIACRFYKKKSIDNSLDWFWEKV